MWVETDNDGHQAILATFYPQFNVVGSGFEYVFLLDLSTSMHGQSMEDMKRHAIIGLRKLEEISKKNPDIKNKFNLYTFGSSFHQLHLGKSTFYFFVDNSF